MEGRALGLVLGELWACGKALYPALAAVTASANAAVAGASNDRGIFERSGSVPGASGAVGTVTGEFYAEWDRMRDELQRVLAEAVQNYYDTGDTLVTITEMYAATDEEAAAELVRQQEEARTGKSLFDTPEEIPYPVTEPSEYVDPIYPDSNP